MQPNYFGSIPAPVRYDKTISDFSKVLFCEITSLMAKEGYCWATNAYFGELYGKHETTISRAISELQKAGYLRLEIITTASGSIRRIYPMLENPLSKNANTPKQKCLDPLAKTLTPLSKNAKQNNIIVSNNKDIDNTAIFQIAEKTPAAPKKDTEQNDGIFTVHDIDSTPTPDGVNAGVFYKFREWGKIRQGKAKRERMTESIWDKVVDKLQKLSSQYAPQVLMEHLDTAIINKWQNPFYNSYEDALIALKAKFEAKEQTKVDEQPLQSELETKYLKSLEWIKGIFPTIESTKIVNINRSQWLDLFDDSGATAKELKIDRLKRFELIKNAILEVSTNSYAQNSAAPLYNHILNHINKKRYGKTNY